MPFGYSSTVKTALAQPVFRPILLIEIESEKTWATVRGRDISWDGKTWTGDAPLLSITGGADTLSPESHALQLTLSAIDPAVRALASPTPSFFNHVRIYRAFLDANLDVIPDPLLVYDEHVDFMSLHHGEIPHLVINCENYAILMAQSAPLLRTHHDHIDAHPGDKFYFHVARLVENPLNVLVGYRPPLSL